MKTLLAIAGLALAILLPESAWGQAVPCRDRAEIIDTFKREYNEVPRWMGVTVSGRNVIEMLRSDEGTFTIIVTTPEGKSCLVAAGEDWEAVPVVKGTGL